MAPEFENNGLTIEGHPVRLDDYYAWVALSAFQSPETVHERWEAFVHENPSPSRLCRLCVKPPCSALLTDPFGVLTDKERWPEHFSGDVGRVSVERWARRYYPVTDDQVDIPWPLPVGARAIGALRGNPYMLAAARSAPFGGDEHAALILSAATKRSEITLYGLVVPDAEFTGFTAAQLRYRVDGEGLISDEDREYVTRFVNHASRWWARFEGKSFRGSPNAGRKKKLPQDTGWLFDKYEEYCDIAEAEQWNTIPLKHFAEFLAPRFNGLHVDTLRDYIKEHVTDKGIAWPPADRQV